MTEEHLLQERLNKIEELKNDYDLYQSQFIKKDDIGRDVSKFNKIKTGDIKPEELLKAKEMIKGRLMLSMEDSMNVASFFGTKKILQNKILTPNEIIKKIEAVTVDEIAKLANDIFVLKNLNFALIGPFETKDFENILNI